MAILYSIPLPFIQFRYSHRNEFQYFIIFYSFTWIFPVYSFFVTLSIVLSDSNSWVFLSILLDRIIFIFSQSQCSYLDLIGDNAFLQYYGAFLFNLFIFCCYFIMSIKLYFKKQGALIKLFLIHYLFTVSVSTRQPLFKSLFLIIFLQIFGWTTSMCAYSFILPALSIEQRSNFVYLINCYCSLTTTAEVVAIYSTR